MNSSSWRQLMVEMNSTPWSPVLWYATPLLMNRIPFRPWPVEHKAVSSVLRYARPRFRRLFPPSRLAPDEHHAFRCLPMNTTHSVASP